MTGARPSGRRDVHPQRPFQTTRTRTAAHHLVSQKRSREIRSPYTGRTFLRPEQVVRKRSHRGDGGGATPARGAGIRQPTQIPPPTEYVGLCSALSAHGFAPRSAATAIRPTHRCQPESEPQSPKRIWPRNGGKGMKTKSLPAPIPLPPFLCPQFRCPMPVRPALSRSRSAHTVCEGRAPTA